MSGRSLGLIFGDFKLLQGTPHVASLADAAKLLHQASAYLAADARCNLGSKGGSPRVLDLIESFMIERRSSDVLYHAAWVLVGYASDKRDSIARPIGFRAASAGRAC